MAEIKITEGIDAEFGSIQNAADQLAATDSSVSAANLSLYTSDLYVLQQKEIQKILAEYRELLQKDVSDLQMMAKSVRAVDQKIANGT